MFSVFSNSILLFSSFLIISGELVIIISLILFLFNIFILKSLLFLLISFSVIFVWLLFVPLLIKLLWRYIKLFSLSNGWLLLLLFFSVSLSWYTLLKCLDKSLTLLFSNSTSWPFKKIFSLLFIYISVLSSFLYI